MFNNHGNIIFSNFENLHIQLKKNKFNFKEFNFERAKNKIFKHIKKNIFL